MVPPEPPTPECHPEPNTNPCQPLKPQSSARTGTIWYLSAWMDIPSCILPLMNKLRHAMTTTLTAVLAAAVVPSLHAQCSDAFFFDQGTNYPQDGSPSALVSADFNLDGTPDIAMINVATNAVRVMLSEPDGGFTPALTIHTVVFPTALATGDLNGDGLADLVVGSTNINEPALRVLLGNGDGTFSSMPPIAYPSEYVPSSMVVCDFDSDGWNDLATTSAHFRLLRLMRGNGDGTFQAATSSFLVDLRPVSLATSDFNGDGRPDFVTANQDSSTNTVSVILSNSVGFGPVTNYPAGSMYITRPSSVAVGDFNGDGRPDIRAAFRNRPGIALGVCDRDGRFPAFEREEFGNPVGQPSAVIAADFNDDGLADYAVNGAYVGDGIPGVILRLSTSPGGAQFNRDATSLLAVDVDSDGRMDLVTSQQDGAFPGITVFRNRRSLVWSWEQRVLACPNGTTSIQMRVCVPTPTIRWQRELAPFSGQFVDLFDGDSSSWDGGDGGVLVSGTNTTRLQLAADSTVGGSLTSSHAIQYRCTVESPRYGTLVSNPVALVLCPSDFNCDGFLDFFDYDQFVACFEAINCPPGKSADFNGDQFVDFFDYDEFVQSFETGC